MNTIYFILALISVAGISLVRGQCDKGPAEWKRPEECCKFNLFKDSVFESCKGEEHGGPQGSGKPPIGKPPIGKPPIGKPPIGGNHTHGKERGYCRFECIFNQSGLYDGKQLNENQIRKTFIEAVNKNDGLIKAVNAALDLCLPIAKKRAAEFTAKEKKCNGAPHFVFACVTGNLVAKCPAALFQSQDVTCVTLQKYFNQCPNGPQ